MATTRSSLLPPGFRFHPTDVELILYYLKRKLLAKPLCFQPIADLDIYNFSPWDLPEKSFLQSRDREWYFFCPRDRKYAIGQRTKRATETGYWRTTGRERAICNDSQIVGMKKTLIFYLGRAPTGGRTNWVMHEYRLEIKALVDAGISQDSYVLCKIFEKSGAGPKNGEQHGAPFKEEEWEDDSVDNSLAPLPLVHIGSPSINMNDDKKAVTGDTTLVLGKAHESSLEPCQNGSNDSVEKSLSLLGGFDIDTMLASFAVKHDTSHFTNDSNEMPELLNNKCDAEAPPLSEGNDIFGGLEDLNRPKLKGLDVCGLTYMEDNFVELDDFDFPMKYPMNDYGPDYIQYDHFDSLSEMDNGAEFGLRNIPVSTDNVFSMELNDPYFPSIYVPEMSSVNLLPGNTNGCNIKDHPEGFSVPFVSEAVSPASTVESPWSMISSSSGVFVNDLGVASNLFKDHVSFGGICGYEDINRNPEVLSGGEEERANSSRLQALAGNSFHYT